MIITNPSHSIRVVTSGETTVTVYASYVDRGRRDADGSSDVYGEADTSIASATTTAIVSGSSSHPAREIVSFRVANSDVSASQTITIQYYNGSAARTLWKGTLGPGEQVSRNGSAFVPVNSSGVPKVAPVVGPNFSSVMVNPLFSTANLTSVRSITSTNTYAVYLGRAPRNLTSVNLRYRVTTACATITWAEAGIAKGSINIGGGPTLTVVGYTDVSGVANSTGQKTTNVPVSAGQAINEGDDIWGLFGNQATTVAVLRGISIADDLQVGVQASLATRPSLNVGNAQTYTIDGATVLSPWIVGVV